MAVYKKCDACGQVWMVSMQQAHKRGKYECPDCERRRNEQDRQRQTFRREEKEDESH